METKANLMSLGEAVLCDRFRDSKMPLIVNEVNTIMKRKGPNELLIMSKRLNAVSGYE